MSNSPTFREIFARIDEAAHNQAQLDEIFSGLGANLKRKAVNAINPTAKGAGERQVDTQALNVYKAWDTYRGQSGAANEGDELKDWIINVLNDKNPAAWDIASTNYLRQFPESGAKFNNSSKSLDKYEIINFLICYIKARNAVKSHSQEIVAQPQISKKKQSPSKPMKHPNTPLGSNLGNENNTQKTS